MRKAWLLAALAGCGSKAASTQEPVAAAKPGLALAEVPAAALGQVHAVSYLTVAAEGTVAIGAIDARGELDVSALAAVETTVDALGGWWSPSTPPIPRSPDAIADAGIFGGMMETTGGFGYGGLGDAYGGMIGDTSGELSTSPCGPALHLDVRDDVEVALLIADANADIHAVLGALAAMPRPVALVARGDDPRGLALRYTIDASANVTDERRLRVHHGEALHVEYADQVAIKIEGDATAQDLLGALGALAVAGVPEVVLDLGETCSVYDYSGGFGFGRAGFGDGGGGEGWGGDGDGTIGHGSGTGSGYGAGNGGSASLPMARLGEVVVTGDLDKAIVRRYLKRHFSKLTYCYEKELLAKPEIAGELELGFEIDDHGRVTASKADGVDADVAACVEGVVRTIEFPRPEDGSVTASTSITYAPTGG